jgi:uncharacterized protein YecE (DUF72 family)
VSLRIGTSGWQYDSWRGVLYPQGVPKRAWLETYADTFPTLEVNNAFYRLPPRETFQGWRDRTPAGFVVAVKASRYLTHIKRLSEPGEPVQRLMDAVAGLGDKLGPILLQLPPTMKADPDRLEASLAAFPKATRVAVEPRHGSWWVDEVREVLTRHNAALCWADRLGRAETPLWHTADWGYMRFHEGAARDWPRYGTSALRSWLSTIGETWSDDADVFAYFNNDQNAAAVHDARHFADLTKDYRRTIA